jgi:hypothetical protein
MSRRIAIIKEQGLERHVGEKNFRIKRLGEEDSIIGTLVRFDKPETPYALKTKKGKIIPLVRGRTRVVIQPSQKLLDAGRIASFMYDYYNPISD